jgi:hypothetical protein
MKVAFRTVTAVACACFFALTSRSATIHVPADQPTIQAGIDAAVDGDTVLVADGTYTGDGNRDIDFKGKAILVASEHGPDFTIVDCQANRDDPHRGFKFVSGEDSLTILQGITVQHAATTGPPDSLRYGAGVLCWNASPTFRNCVFKVNYGELGGGAAVRGNSSPLFENCHFRGNACMTFGGGVFVWTNYQVPPTRFRRCVFQSNMAGHAGGALLSEVSHTTSDSCIYFDNYGPDEGGACDFGGGTHVVRNCTFVGNYSDGFGDAISSVAGNLELNSCLIALNRGGDAFHIEADTNVVFLCNNVNGNLGGDWVGEIAGYFGQDGNFSSDPFFCDTADGNVSLRETSPCLPSMNSCGVLVGAIGIGCSATDVADTVNFMPDGIVGAGQNYPNPFNSRTVFTLRLTRVSDVTIEVFDALGRRISVLFSGGMSAGEHHINWEGKDDSGAELPSGPYFCRIIGGTRINVVKVMILR